MAEISSKQRALGLALGVAFFGLVSLDFVVLKGERVAGGSLSLRPDSAPVELQIDRPGAEHLVQISTRRHRNNETKGRAISYRLLDPEGRVVAEDSELVSRKSRFFEFTPRQPGRYSLHAEEKTLIGGGRGSGSVEVTVGDRRMLSRWVRF